MRVRDTGDDDGARTVEVVQLALHGTEATHLPHELKDPNQLPTRRMCSLLSYPAVHLVVLRCSKWVRHLVVLVILINEVLQHCTTLED